MVSSLQNRIFWGTIIYLLRWHSILFQGTYLEIKNAFLKIDGLLNVHFWRERLDREQVLKSVGNYYNAKFA